VKECGGFQYCLWVLRMRYMGLRNVREVALGDSQVLEGSRRRPVMKQEWKEK
jgi:hypothetical protein